MHPKNFPYNQFDKDELILRDYLAIDRTILANQNTLLAHVRTALTLVVSGVSFIHFFDLGLIEMIGWVLIPIGFLIFLIGLNNYYRITSQLETLKRDRLLEVKENKNNYFNIPSAENFYLLHKALFLTKQNSEF